MIRAFAIYPPFFYICIEILPNHERNGCIDSLLRHA